MTAAKDLQGGGIVCEHGEFIHPFICIFCKNNKLRKICSEQDSEIIRLRGCLKNIAATLRRDIKISKHPLIAMGDIAHYAEKEAETIHPQN